MAVFIENLNRAIAEAPRNPQSTDDTGRGFAAAIARFHSARGTLRWSRSYGVEKERANLGRDIVQRHNKRSPSWCTSLDATLWCSVRRERQADDLSTSNNSPNWYRHHLGSCTVKWDETVCGGFWQPTQKPWRLRQRS